MLGEVGWSLLGNAAYLVVLGRRSASSGPRGGSSGCCSPEPPARDVRATLDGVDAPSAAGTLAG